MILWVIMTCLVALVSVAVTISLVRRHDGRTEASGLSILLGQLDEVDLQQKAGAIPDETAEQTRIEIKRRILAEGNAATRRSRPLAPRARIAIAFGVAGFIAVGAATLYALRGAPDTIVQSAQASAPVGAQGGDHPAGDAEAMVRSLEKRLEAEPNDAEGWRMLGWSYFQLRRFADSAMAYGKARQINPADPGYASAMGEALVQASDGVVTAEARSAFEAARKADQTDARARYFLAVLKEQQGDAKGAIDDWLALLSESPSDAPWVPHLRQAITDSAARAGVDIKGRMPAADAAAPRLTPGDVSAAEQLAPEDRDKMIRSMVDGLAAKLAANAHDAEGWMRLMRARMVLGDKASAANAYQTARQTFAKDPATLDRLAQAAQELGLSGAAAR